MCWTSDTAAIRGPIFVGHDPVVDMSVGHLMANTREDIHVTASVMAEMERLNIIQRRSNPVGVTGSLWNQDDTAPLSVMNRLR